MSERLLKPNMNTTDLGSKSNNRGIGHIRIFCNPAQAGLFFVQKR